MLEVFIAGRRDAYGTEDIKKTLTVRELIEYLEEIEESYNCSDAKIYLINDGGYTYGSITKGSFDIQTKEGNE